ncbi:MAG: CDP-glycerol glycerophosphotransferase family protein [Clostridia bacterium]|nr:CDP-glycerol glycerophosphotransferase family protein [Clostridia bacterium]
MKKLLYWIRLIIHLNLPILKNVVLFRSFYGQYNDNPKYIFEELHKRNKNIKTVWVTGVGKKQSFPEGVETVELHSKEYAKYIARAKVVVDNYTGIRSNFIKGNNIFKRALYKYTAKKRKGQLNISTWHGTPLKKIALDEPQYKNKKHSKAYLNTDILLSGCNVTANSFITAFKFKGEILKFGTPRNDILFKPETKEELKKKLGLPLNKKVILFAPTFRDSLEMSGLYQMKNLDINNLLTKLSNKFGGEWCFVFRTHNLVFQKIQEEGLKINENVINGNKFDDMAEYLVCTDLLLTDYSGSMFDYLITKKPCLLYTPDLDNYKNNERGFYLNIDKLPYKPCVTEEELIKEIEDFNEEKYICKVNEFLVKIENTETGEASKKVVDIIETHLEK